MNKQKERQVVIGVILVLVLAIIGSNIGFFSVLGVSENVLDYSRDLSDGSNLWIHQSNIPFESYHPSKEYYESGERKDPIQIRKADASASTYHSFSSSEIQDIEGDGGSLYGNFPLASRLASNYDLNFSNIKEITFDMVADRNRKQIGSLGRPHTSLWIGEDLQLSIRGFEYSSEDGKVNGTIKPKIEIFSAGIPVGKTSFSSTVSYRIVNDGESVMLFGSDGTSRKLFVVDNLIYEFVLYTEYQGNYGGSARIDVTNLKISYKNPPSTGGGQSPGTPSTGGGQSPGTKEEPEKDSTQLQTILAVGALLSILGLGLLYFIKRKG